ncbi:MAG: DNA polymerase III subunit beta [Nitrospirae bacterium]|nr:DNA polymerase III subunit beta [Nitrospirota bacterium]
MKLTVPKQELLEKLSDIQNVVEKRNTMPILSHFLLEAKKTKGSYIMATDLETAIKEPIALSVEKEGRLSIPARKLFEIVREVDGDISIESEDGNWIRVKAGTSNFRLACLPPEDFPEWPKMESGEELQIEAKMLSEMIEKTIYAAGESDTRYTLNGILFHIHEGTFTAVGTDGHRMAVLSKETTPVKEEKNAIVPRKAAGELRKFLDKDGAVSVTIGKNHVLFKVGEITFLARLIEGTYPNYTKVVPTENEKKLLIDKEAVIKALRRVAIMSRERSSAVKADISKGMLTLTTSNPDLGEASDEVNIDYKGEDLTIGFNARYLLDALSAISTDKAVFELHDQLSPTLLKEEGSEAYKCVVMPMRL